MNDELAAFKRGVGSNFFPVLLDNYQELKDLMRNLLQAGLLRYREGEILSGADRGPIDLNPAQSAIVKVLCQELGLEVTE